MGFSRQEYWSGLLSSPPGHLPDSGIKPMSLLSPAFMSGFFTTSATWEAPWGFTGHFKTQAFIPAIARFSVQDYPI